MNLTEKDITIVVASLERPHFLVQTLNSIKDYCPENVIVYENGTKQKLNQIKAYAQKFKRFHWVMADTNMGLSYAWNQGLKLAKTDWIALAPDDVIFRPDWIDDFNKVLSVREGIIFVGGQHFDLPVMHRSILDRVGYWDERYAGGVDAQDDDYYLRMVEILGFSPQVWPGDHIQGPERQRRLKLATTEETFNRKDNWTYFCDSRWSIVPTLVNSIPHPVNHNWDEFLEREENGITFHHKKWNPCSPNDPKALLAKDGTFWKRILPDEK